jgi:hypothetical protein
MKFSEKTKAILTTFSLAFLRISIIIEAVKKFYAYNQESFGVY